VYGALLWSMGKVFRGAEVVKQHLCNQSKISFFPSMRFNPLQIY
jgi:hypothetical protein